MDNPIIPLPKYAKPLLWVAAICAVIEWEWLFPWFSEYKPIIDVIFFASSGSLFVYLSYALPKGILKQANEGRSSLRKIPNPGPLARPLCIVLGIALILASIFGAWNI